MVSLPPRATITSRFAVPLMVLALSLPTMVAFTPPHVGRRGLRRRHESERRGQADGGDDGRDERWDETHGDPRGIVDRGRIYRILRLSNPPR